MQSNTEVHVTFDLEYGPAEERNQCDLFMPRGGSTPLPLIFCIHGGGWQGGSKEAWAASALHLARHGFACMALRCVVDLFGPVDLCAMMDTASRPLVADYMALPYPDTQPATLKARQWQPPCRDSCLLPPAYRRTNHRIPAAR